MLTQVHGTKNGYIVELYDNEQWRPLRNFGERAGDAIRYAYDDCRKLDLAILRATAAKYNPCQIWQRLKFGSYRIIANR